MSNAILKLKLKSTTVSRSCCFPFMERFKAELWYRSKELGLEDGSEDEGIIAVLEKQNDIVFGIIFCELSSSSDPLSLMLDVDEDDNTNLIGLDYTIVHGSWLQRRISSGLACCSCNAAEECHAWWNERRA
jgi:hypothetical protein